MPASAGITARRNATERARNTAALGEKVPGGVEPRTAPRKERSVQYPGTVVPADLVSHAVAR